MKIKPIRIRIPQGGPRQGFTLVELLVTITIIIVLAGLVFVSTGKIRASAQQANAVASLRQIGIANVAYSAENSGAINVIRDPGEWGSGFEGPGSSFASNSFVGRMQPFLFTGIASNNEKNLGLKTESLLGTLFNTTKIESMAGTPFGGVPVYADGSGISNPIAVNIKLRPAWRQAPLKVSSFGNPSGTLYLALGRYYFDQPQVGEYTPLPLPGDRRRAVYYLPNRKGIFCFLDGHVELVSPPIPDRFLGQSES
ncbi:MAG: hypothetical protein RLZZ214_527 [Verrucomicrobiota bacterium]|jgi:prepilin-type N-terminal cleavage/methylation domain-containing protein/prepilin-type processing-associated H-X9-DG protein